MDDMIRRTNKRSPLAVVAPPSGPALSEPPKEVAQPKVIEEPFGELPLPKPPRKGRLKFKLPRPKTKLQWIIFGVIVAAVLGATATAVYWFIIRDTSPPPAAYVEPEPEPEPEPTTMASRVSGRQLDKAAAIKPIYAVQIENSPEARPQSGLREADIVSEAIAEGGITRFNAIYHDNVPANIGPVRSLRPYYIDWFLPYNAPIVHAGGSPEALADIRSLGIQDMDNTAGYFRRVSNRYAPHNLYTTGGQILELFTARGYNNGDSITSLPRKEIKPAADPESAETPAASTLPAATAINLAVSRGLYNVSFAYDAATNTYLRSQGGAAHVDADTGAQIAPDVIVVPIMSRSTHANRVHTVYGTTGSGEVFVFQDGTVTKGTWTKPDRRSQWQLKDASGNDIKLNPGQTWFTMIESADRVGYQ